MTYEDFAEKLLSSPGGYEIVEVRNGQTHTYRGRAVSAFIARGDHRQHEHKVTTSSGGVVYHRDASGVVRIGTAGQFLAAKDPGRLVRSSSRARRLVAEGVEETEFSKRSARSEHMSRTIDFCFSRR